MTKRKKLIGFIQNYSSDEFETFDDVFDLAGKSDVELIKECKGIVQYFEDNKIDDEDTFYKNVEKELNKIIC